MRAGTSLRAAVSNQGMNIERLRILIAPALAGLFLVLTLCTFAVRRPGAVGILVPLPRIQRHADWRECEDDMPIFVLIHKNGNIYIRQTQENPSDLAATIVRIMSNRATERAVYIVPDSDVSFSQVADIYDKIVGSTTNIHVFLVTERMRELGKASDATGILWGLCDLEWPENGYKAESWYAQPVGPREY